MLGCCTFTSFMFGLIVGCVSRRCLPLSNAPWLLMHHTKCGGITHPPYVVLYLRRLLAFVPSSYTIYVPFSLSIKMATNDRRRMVLLPSPPPEYFRRSFISAPSLLPSRRKPNTNSFVPVYYYRMSHCAELMHYLSFIRLALHSTLLYVPHSLFHFLKKDYTLLSHTPRTSRISSRCSINPRMIPRRERYRILWRYAVSSLS